MSAPQRVLKVFLSSSGDVSEERALAERVLKRLGEEHRERLRLVLVLWEHEPLFAHAGFQEQIERPSQCDLVVIMLWSRLGTRLPASFALSTGEAPPTGTEFEVQDALESYRRLGRPHLLIYRRTAPPHVNLASPDAEERLAQYRMLQDFCRRAFYDDQGAVIVAHHDYAESWEFERKLTEHTRKWLEREVGQGAGLPRWTAGSPYRGLQAFESEHREIYFGRSQSQSELIELLRGIEERAGEGGTRFLLVQGMSGNGKSSLVRAGLLPLLEGRAVEGIGNWRHLIVKPSDHGAEGPGVFGALAERLLAALPGLQARYTPRTLAERLLAAPAESAARLEGYLTQEASRLGLNARQIRLLVFVDQLEEAWSPALGGEERQALARCLAVLAREGRTWVIATLRSDFAANFESVPEYHALLKAGQLYVLAAPQGDELGEMIREPAAAAGLEWETREGLSLDQAIQREATESPESLPLLEYALDQLYERREGRRLTYAAYEALGRLSGGIAASAEAVLTEQEEAGKAALEKLLRSLVSVDESGQATRRYARLTEIPKGSGELMLLARLIERRLCVADNRGQGAEVSLAHEALLRTWPRLTDWLAQESGLLQARELAQRDTRLWLEHARSDAWLAAADKVASIKALETAAIPLPAEVRNFIDRSERQVRRTTRIKQAAVGVIALLAMAALIGAWVASKKEREAEYQTAEARKAQRQILTDAAAERLKDGDLTLARGMMLEVFRQRTASDPPDPAAINVLLEIGATDPAVAILSGHSAPVYRVTYSPDGTRIVTASYDHTARVWDARTGLELQRLSGHLGMVRSVHYSPDGTRIVSASKDGTRIWDAGTGALLLVIRSPEKMNSAAYSPDGARIVTSFSKGVRVWDVRTGARVAEFVGSGEEEFSQASFSPDGSRIAVAVGRTVRVLNAHNGSELLVLAGHHDGVRSLVYSPDGTRLLTSANDVRVWDARSGAQLLLIEHGNAPEVWDAAYSPDGRTIASAGPDKTVRLWDATKGKQLQVLSGHVNVVDSVAFSPDGKHLVSGAHDLTARIWDLRDGPDALVIRHGDRVTSVAYSPDGTRLLTASADKTARIWDAQTGSAVAVLSGHTKGLDSAIYSPDGTRILTASDDKSIRIWDARSGAPLLTVATPDWVTSIAYSPDGRRIVASYADLTFGTRDASSGIPISAFKAAHRDYVTSTVYSPDGARILTGSVDKTVRVWDPQSLTQLLVIPQKDFVQDAVYSPDGQLILSVGNDTLGYILSAGTGEELRVLAGHHSALAAAAFSPDGRRIVTGSYDQTVRIWDAQTGSQLAVLLGHHDVVQGVCFSPDGRHVASASADNTARIWDARIPADWHSQLLWQQAVEADPLSDVQRTFLGVPSTMGLLVKEALDADARKRSHPITRAGPSRCAQQAGAYYDPDGEGPGVEQSAINPDLATAACARSGAATSGSAQLTYQAGRALLATGDFASARRDFELAVSQGYRAARLDLALLLKDPSANMLDPKRAASLLKQAWNSGIAMAGFELGSLYEHGLVGSQDAASGWQTDTVEAWHWYEEAARRFEPHALARLAERTEREVITGSKPDVELLSAFSLYTRAAERARQLGWPDNVWRSWRYRRATLAHILAAAGLMQQAAGAYEEAILAESRHGEAGT